MSDGLDWRPENHDKKQCLILILLYFMYIKCSKTKTPCIVILVWVTLVAGLGACATAPENKSDAGPPVENSDPLEGFNRAMYQFNDGLDDYVFKPVAQGYEWVLPQVMRRGVANFFSNLLEPMVVLNDLLQGKFAQASSDSARFLVNTTLGLGGLFDVATPMALPKHKEDFGQTLGVWGLGQGAYVVWPFLGPMNVRDSFGWGMDWLSSPVSYVQPAEVSWGLWLTDKVDQRAWALGAKDVLEQAASDDPYIFVREAYRQKRRNDIYDGDPPATQLSPLDDDLLYQDDPPLAK